MEHVFHRFPKSALPVVDRGDGMYVYDKDGNEYLDACGGAAKAKLEFEMVVESVQVPRERMPKQVVYVPAIVLLGLIWMLQRRRRNDKSVQQAAA